MIGKHLGGRYELVSRIGGGGMAIVYQGTDLLLNRTVAVKVLRQQFCHDDDFIDRFRREAQSAASLSHPNVVSIYDVGQEEEIHYIVMEYIEGPTLKERIIERAPLPLQESIRIAIEIAEALENAHQNHIIHRDIKPHNILIGRNGRVKVADFGIARAVTSSTLTHTGSIIGSVHYFSPEQAKGGITGVQSDIYSLGIVLYEMLTAKLPFTGDSPISVALMHVQNTYIEPRELNRFIPQSVENIITKAMAKDLQWRYASVREMLIDLENCLLPGHESDKKFVLPSSPYLDEETRVIPALTPSMWDNQYSEGNKRSDRSGRNDKSPQKNRSQLFIKPFIWLLSIVILIVLGFIGLQYLLGKMYVQDVDVPDVINLDEAEATELLEGLTFEVIREEGFDNEIAKGKVFKQLPGAKTTVKENSEVTIFVSQGKEAIPVPDLTGKTEAQAEDQLSQSQFKSWEPKPEFNKDVPEGKIIRQEPEPNKEVIPDDTTIVYYVSKGAESFEAPNLIGKNIEQAKAEVEKLDLKLGVPVYQDSYLEKDLVIKQFPYNPGDPVSAGAEIQIFVSNGKLPGDAKNVDVPISIFPDQGKETEVIILVSDARGDKQQVTKEVISQPKEFTVSLVLSPDKSGLIQVYRDGSLFSEQTVPYNSEGG